jgi:hypothetical protein
MFVVPAELDINVPAVLYFAFEANDPIPLLVPKAFDVIALKAPALAMPPLIALAETSIPVDVKEPSEVIKAPVELAVVELSPCVAMFKLIGFVAAVAAITTEFVITEFGIISETNVDGAAPFDCNICPRTPVGSDEPLATHEVFVPSVPSTFPELLAWEGSKLFTAALAVVAFVPPLTIGVIPVPRYVDTPDPSPVIEPMAGVIVTFAALVICPCEFTAYVGVAIALP